MIAVAANTERRREIVGLGIENFAEPADKIATSSPCRSRSRPPER
jgi:hypothetical protein